MRALLSPAMSRRKQSNPKPCKREYKLGGDVFSAVAALACCGALCARLAVRYRGLIPSPRGDSLHRGASERMVDHSTA